MLIGIVVEGWLERRGRFEREDEVEGDFVRMVKEVLFIFFYVIYIFLEDVMIEVRNVVFKL